MLFLPDGYAHYPLAQWRNGQWADPMLAHAGAEAVRLVPFSSLLLSAESLSDYRSSSPLSGAKRIATSQLNAYA